MPERDKKIDALYQMVQQNNKMLRSMKRAAFWGSIFKILFYAVVLGIPVYLFFTIFQPILASLLDTYSQIQQTGAQLQNVGSQVQDVTNLIPVDKFKSLLNNIPAVNIGE
ncbi:MAG: hypothetical protein JKX80_01200 [Candidatus Pacebacteria bacterium]|nr:hypothetical protein [Candidatus Paceibacterota bacterium]